VSLFHAHELSILIRSKLMPNSTNSQLPYRWDLLLRYRLIEIISLWEGRLTTKVLIQAFGIGRQQASKDINFYIKQIAPNNLEYDKTLKGYKPTSQFAPILTRGEISEYLHLLNSQADLLSSFEQIAQSQANTEMLTPPIRSIDPMIIRPIIQAAREGKRIDIRYLSMTSPEPKERIISPHTIVFNGYRWHIRAFCEAQKSFRDFVLSRIVEVYDLEGTASKLATSDTAWQAEVEIIIAPDNRLTPHQQSIIARDYAMSGNERSFKTRGALVTYYLQLLNLDYLTPHDNPNIQQIIVVNLKELKQWRF
jgi:predicted DNA-binding transcriptional regulator YafY